MLTELMTPIPVRFAFIDGKDVGPQTFPGELRALSDSQSQARLHTDEMLPEFSNLRIDLLDSQGEPLPDAVYAKVVEGDVGVVHFTTRSSSLDAALAQGREPTL